MNAELCFAIHNDEVSHNQFDNEIIAIHLDSGKYFSLRGSAAVIWARLQEGPATIADLVNLFAPGPDDLSAPIGAFLNELTGHRILTQCATVSALAPGTTALVAFTPLVVESFSDLQNLLLADPIHDVSPAGWPATPAADSRAA